MSPNVLGAIQHACNFLHHSEAKMFLQKLPLLVLICGVHNIPLAISSIATRSREHASKTELDSGTSSQTQR